MTLQEAGNPLTFVHVAVWFGALLDSKFKLDKNSGLKICLDFENEQYRLFDQARRAWSVLEPFQVYVSYLSYFFLFFFIYILILSQNKVS